MELRLRMSEPGTDSIGCDRTQSRLPPLNNIHDDVEQLPEAQENFLVIAFRCAPLNTDKVRSYRSDGQREARVEL